MRMHVLPPQCLLTKEVFSITPRLLMGPGPSNCSPRVMRTLSEPVTGAFDTESLQIMDDIKEGIKYIYQTMNPLSFCLSGSGTCGMEAALANLIEPGDVILVCITGLWGQRAADIASRYGADVRELAVKEFGTTLSYQEIANAIEYHRPGIVFIVHADSSTGVHQRIEGIGSICRKFNALLIVDAVASVAGMELLTDEWQCDLVYGGAQKCIGSIVGMTPITFNNRCFMKIDGRKTKPITYYLDLILIAQFWGCLPDRPRIYHHTVCTNLMYAFREALREISEEGLERRVARHDDAAKYLRQKLADAKFEFFVERPDDRLTTVTTIRMPVGCDHPSIAKYAIEHYGVQISGGLGPTVGLVLRIGLMGHNATRANVDKYVRVLAEATQQLKAKI